MELLFAISDGDKTQIDAWRGTSVFKFYLGLWIKDDQNQKRLEALEAIKHKNKHR